MVNEPKVYSSLGVSAHKSKIKSLVSKYTNNDLYKNSFCVIIEDYLSKNIKKCLVQHSDGIGSKGLVAYLSYQYQKDPSVFRTLANDALVMNTDDMLCVGALGPYLLSNTISRNLNRIPTKVLEEIFIGFEESINLLGIKIYSSGGETADVGSIVNTLSLDVTLTGMMDKEDVIDGSKIKDGDIIIGLASDGQTSYEEKYNSGIGCNGLTHARNVLLEKKYIKSYPEVLDKAINEDLQFRGRHSLESLVPETDLTISEALLSPTRTYVPVIQPLLEQYPDLISGIVHCTGGGQTKCLKVGKNIEYIKNQLFDPPPIFKLIQAENKTLWRDMYQIYNMGHRMEVIGDSKLFKIISDITKPLNLKTKIIGYCKRTEEVKNKVLIKCQ